MATRRLPSRVRVARSIGPHPGGWRMAQVLFVQGGGAGAHDAWDNKLVASLEAKLGPGFELFYPRMPNEADPKYEAWTQELERAFATLGEDALLVGHSIGGAILIHTLAEARPDQKV